MIKVAENISAIKNEVDLSINEKAILVSYVKQDGFLVIQKLFEDQINRFNLKLINSNPADHNEVLANHIKAQTAAQIWAGFVERINHEIEMYEKNIHNFKQPEVPVQIEEFM